MADLPCLDGPARFCLLSGSVPPSQTLLLAAAVSIPTEQALDSLTLTLTHTKHTHTLLALGTFCLAHTISLSTSLMLVYPFQNSPTHRAPFWFHPEQFQAVPSTDARLES